MRDNMEQLPNGGPGGYYGDDDIPDDEEEEEDDEYDYEPTEEELFPELRDDD